MPRRYFKILVLLLLLQINVAHAQARYQLLLQPDSAASGWFDKNFPPQQERMDSVACLTRINEVLQSLTLASYLTATITEVVFYDSVCVAKVYPGKSYQWLNVHTGDIPLEILEASGWRDNQFLNTPVLFQRYLDKVKRMLQYLEQNGYPFARIYLDSIAADTQTLSARLILDKGDFIRFDTMEVIGDAAVKGWFLARYLGIRKDAPYNEQLIKNAAARLSQLPFLSITRSPMVYFLGTSAKPVVYLSNRKSSSLDGIIGFAPASDNNSNKLLVTGEVNLKLQNLFATGKAFDLSYKSFLTGSQELKTHVLWPYIFRSGVGLEYDLNLLKYDSTFLDVKQEIGVQYRLIGNDYIRVFYGLQQTSLLTVDTNLIKVTKALPAANDLTNHQYGLGFKISRYDYYLNPTKGGGVEFSGSAGLKRIGRNPTVDGLRFAQTDGSFKSIYDTLKLSSVQYRFTLRGDVFIPLHKRATLRFEVISGHIQAQTLFVSELFRIGGIRTLKGFDEQAIFASSYGIINTEIRYLLQQNSHVMLFWNGAWYENAIRKPVLTDTPYGVGAGLNFETGAGIFSLYYAVGKQFNNPLELNKAKIHFGFVNYF